MKRFSDRGNATRPMDDDNDSQDDEDDDPNAGNGGGMDDEDDSDDSDDSDDTQDSEDDPDDQEDDQDEDAPPPMRGRAAERMSKAVANARTGNTGNTGNGAGGDDEQMAIMDATEFMRQVRGAINTSVRKAVSELLTPEVIGDAVLKSLGTPGGQRVIAKAISREFAQTNSLVKAVGEALDEMNDESGDRHDALNGTLTTVSKSLTDFAPVIKGLGTAGGGSSAAATSGTSGTVTAAPNGTKPASTETVVDETTLQKGVVTEPAFGEVDGSAVVKLIERGEALQYEHGQHVPGMSEAVVAYSASRPLSAGQYAELKKSVEAGEALIKKA